VLTRLSKLAIVVALASSIGLPWALLQSLAWTTMLADNLRTSALLDAVQRTFDGKHPCVLCKAISNAKKSQSKSELPPQLKKLELFNPPARIFFIPAAHFGFVRAANPPGSSLAYPPLLPPPRSISA